MRRFKEPAVVVFLLTIALFMCGIALRFLTRQVLVERFGMDNAFTRTIFFDAEDMGSIEKTEEGAATEGPVDIDWSELYPFPDGARTEVAGDSQSDASGGWPGLSRYASVVESAKTKIETYATAHLPLRQAIVELANDYERRVRWDYVCYSEYNGIVSASDGYLTRVFPRIDVGEPADATASLARYCEGVGIPLVYVCTPFKICKYDDADLSGVTDFSNQNADEFLALASAEGVQTLDLREELHGEGLSHHALFFRTDHHWLPQTGLWASGKVAALLEERCGMDVDPGRLNPDVFRSETYRDWFLGSQGKKVTLKRADPEDFTLLYPEYETSLHYEVKSLGIDTEGDFSILYDMEQVAERDYYRLNPYAAYIHSDQPLEVIVNEDDDLSGHLLVVHDSFGNTVVPFLAMGLERVDSIDLRYFNGSLRRYIEVERPDAIVILYNPGMLLVEEGFRFD